MERNTDGTFKEGHSNGRPKGAANKTTKQLREAITAFIADKQDQFETDWKELSAKDRVRAYIDLVQYVLPKLKAVEAIEPKEKEVKPPIQWVK